MIATDNTLAMRLLAALAALALTIMIPVSAGAEESRFVRLGLNKSMVIRLPTPTRDVLLGNPAIVDAVVRTQNTAYLFAKSVGQTNAFFFDAEGRQILSLDIEVALDGKALQKLISRAIPDSHITVDTVNSNVILAGTAATPPRHARPSISQPPSSTALPADRPAVHRVPLRPAEPSLLPAAALALGAPAMSSTTSSSLARSRSCSACASPSCSAMS